MNGNLKGTLAAFDEAEEPVGWEESGNWSSSAFREKAARGLAEATDISEDRAKALLVRVLKEARKATEDAPIGSAEPLGETEISARLPGLVDVVEAEGGGLAYLFLENGRLVTRAEYASSGKRFVPPSSDHLPYKVPRETQVRLAFSADSDDIFFHDLIEWHRAASVLPGDHHYLLVALFVLHTYLADLAHYSLYLTFQSLDTERGKTRAAKAVCFVSYRGILTETLQEANLFRWADSLGCTLVIDVKDLWRKAERRGAEDILLSRIDRYGPKVARVLDPQAGPFKGVTYYDVYGPTVVAMNEPLKEPLLSRSIPIVPPEVSGKYANLSDVGGLPLRERGVAFRARHMGASLPNVPKPAVGRLGDILQPLAQVAALIGGEVEDAFPSVVDTFAQAKLLERSESFEGRLVRAVVKVAEAEMVDGKLPTEAVTNAFNEGLGERSQLSPESIGKKLGSLGFRAARLSGGGRAKYFDDVLVAALRPKFGVDLVETDQALQEPPHLSQPSQRGTPVDGQGAPASDSSVTGRSTVTDSPDNRHKPVTEQEGGHEAGDRAQVPGVADVTVPATAINEADRERGVI